MPSTISWSWSGLGLLDRDDPLRCRPSASPRRCSRTPTRRWRQWRRWAIFSKVLIFFERRWSSATTSVARSMPRLRSIGFIHAATDLAPSRTIDAASTVAVVRRRRNRRRCRPRCEAATRRPEPRAADQDVQVQVAVDAEPAERAGIRTPPPFPAPAMISMQRTFGAPVMVRLRNAAAIVAGVAARSSRIFFFFMLLRTRSAYCWPCAQWWLNHQHIKDIARLDFVGILSVGICLKQLRYGQSVTHCNLSRWSHRVVQCKSYEGVSFVNRTPC